MLQRVNLQHYLMRTRLAFTAFKTNAATNSEFRREVC